MKCLALIFLFGIAAATAFKDVWERERDKTISDFTNGMKMAGPLRMAMGMYDARELDEVENDIKNELGEVLKEALDQIMKKIKDAVEKGKDVHKDLVDRAKAIMDHLRELHITVGDNTKDMIERLKEKAKDWLKTLLEKLLRDKRQTMEAAEEFNLKEIIGKVLEKLKEKIHVDKIREYIKDKNDKIQEMAKVIIEFFNEGNGRQEIVDIIEKLLKKEKETRSLKESWEEMKQRLKDFFKEKHLELKEKYSAFFEWLKESVLKGLEISKDRREALKNIARELIKYSKEVSKEVAIEALDALKPYKGELGEIWEELRKKVKEILHRND